MGCDIHSMLEIYRPAGWDREDDPAGWKRVTVALFESPYYSTERPISLYNVPFSSEPLHARHYRMFAMLADVRNGRGFGGIDTGDRVEPIAEPKGVPHDASADWVDYVDSWGPDLHSTSFFTLAELDAYDWNGLVFERGYLHEREYRAVRGTEAVPTSWSGGVSGPGITSMTAAEYEALSTEGLAQVRAQFPASDERWFSRGIYVQHQWVETRRQNMGELEQAMATMRECAPSRVGGHSTPDDIDPTKIRIVFGFDN